MIALSLLGELARQGRTVVHATGSRSFTQTVRKVAAKGAPRVQKSFQYFNSFMQSEPKLPARPEDRRRRGRSRCAGRQPPRPMTDALTVRRCSQ